MSSLSEIDFSVPSSPDSEWSEHSTGSAHVTISGLSGSAGTRTSDSWNSCDGSTGTPGKSGVLHTGEMVDSSGLSAVLGEVVVNERDDVLSQRSVEHGWESNLS